MPPCESTLHNVAGPCPREAAPGARVCTLCESRIVSAMARGIGFDLVTEHQKQHENDRSESCDS